MSLEFGNKDHIEKVKRVEQMLVNLRDDKTMKGFCAANGLTEEYTKYKAALNYHTDYKKQNPQDVGVTRIISQLKADMLQKCAEVLDKTIM